MGIREEFVLTRVMSSLISLLSVLSMPQLSYGFPSPKPTLLDLSYSFTSSSPYPIWPGNTPFTLTTILNSTKNRFHTFISQHDISMSEHIGTHMDAPSHFNHLGLSTSEIPLDKLVDV